MEGITNVILKFADDTKVFGKVMDEKDKDMLQTDLNKLTLWAQKWKMEFNVAKCKVMHTGNKNNEFNSTQLNSTGDYGRRCLTPLCPHHYQHNYIIKTL